MSRRSLLDDAILLLAVGLLAVLFVSAIRNGADLPGNEGLRGRSGDFSQFYVAGLLANRGEIDRLYDQAYSSGCSTIGKRTAACSRSIPRAGTSLS